MILRRRYLRLVGDYPCAQFVEAVTAYLEGAMPDDERARFEHHLEQCAGCSTYLDQMRRTIELVGAITVDDVERFPRFGPRRAPPHLP